MATRSHKIWVVWDDDEDPNATLTCSGCEWAKDSSSDVFGDLLDIADAHWDRMGDTTTPRGLWMETAGMPMFMERPKDD